MTIASAGFKLVLLIVSGTYQHLGVRPPTPAPSEKERVRDVQALEYVVRAFTQIFSALSSIAFLAQAYFLCITAFNWKGFSPLTNIFLPRGFGDVVSLQTITPAFLAGAVLVTLGGLLRRWCYRVMDDMFTFESTIKEDHRLVTSGPYQYVRHPSYTAAFMIWFGVPLALMTRGSWISEGHIMATPGRYFIIAWFTIVGLTMIGILKRMPTEDKNLQNKFGAEWERYRRAVPHALVPYIY